jgi:hypothetical protein
VDYLIGAALALGFGYALIRAGEVARRRGIVLERRIAWALGMAVGIAVWLILRMLLPVSHPIYDGAAIGLGVGIYQGFARPDAAEKKK